MYTLKQLAHFDRCLFPDDFEKELIEEGVDANDAYFVSSAMKSYTRGGGRNTIVGLYQMFIDDEQLTSAFDRILVKFVEKYP